MRIITYLGLLPAGARLSMEALLRFKALVLIAVTVKRRSLRYIARPVAVSVCRVFRRDTSPCSSVYDGQHMSTHEEKPIQTAPSQCMRLPKIHHSNPTAISGMYKSLPSWLWPLP